MGKTVLIAIVVMLRRRLDMNAIAGNDADAVLHELAGNDASNDGAIS